MKMDYTVDKQEIAISFAKTTNILQYLSEVANENFLNYESKENAMSIVTRLLKVKILIEERNNI